MVSKLTTFKFSQADQILIDLVKAHSRAPSASEAIRMALRFYVDEKLRKDPANTFVFRELDELTRVPGPAEILAKWNAEMPAFPMPKVIPPGRVVITPTMQPKRPKTTGRIR